MAKLILNGSTSGSITLESPAVSGTNTLTLPANTGTVLTSASNTNFPTGSIVQVVQGTTTTQTSSTSTSYADTTLSTSITPSSSSNKILVLVSHNHNYKTSGNSSNSIGFKLFRGSTEIFNPAIYLGFTGTAMGLYFPFSFSYLDSPSTTSSTTYKTQFANSLTASATIYVQADSVTSTITLMEIKA
jgi:hypothetical protein